MSKLRSIDWAIGELSRRLGSLEVEALDISAYNKRYLGQYKAHFSFYMSAYRQLFSKAIAGLDRPVKESTLVDYGGGCGVLSFLAKLIGFQRVFYLDLFDISVKDARSIAQALDIPVNQFLEGDIGQLSNWLHHNKVEPDLICSFDVLEHIYDLEDWFQSLSQLNGKFALYFMTSANPANPLVRRKLRKLHRQAELEGFERAKGWKESDTHRAFLGERKKLIQNYFPQLSSEEINWLATRSRGLRKDDIKEVVGQYVRDGKLNYQIADPTNTCDPYTGNWAERLISPRELTGLAEAHGFRVRLTNTFYGYSGRFLLNLPKALLNGLISLLGQGNLSFSPAYVLELYR